MVSGLEITRSRLLWLSITAVIIGILLLVLHPFIGTFISGVLSYYAARPLYRRLRVNIGSRGVGAATALFA